MLPSTATDLAVLTRLPQSVTPRSSLREGPVQISHGGSRGFKSRHLHPTSSMTSGTLVMLDLLYAFSCTQGQFHIPRPSGWRSVVPSTATGDRDFHSRWLTLDEKRVVSEDDEIRAKRNSVSRTASALAARLPSASCLYARLERNALILVVPGSSRSCLYAGDSTAISAILPSALLWMPQP
jgi:hypothetical protein